MTTAKIQTVKGLRTEIERGLFSERECAILEFINQQIPNWCGCFSKEGHREWKNF